jgi:hypothetical protein
VLALDVEPQMTIELPASFAPRVNSLVACLDRYDDPARALSDSERVNLQREALSLCCALLGSVNLDQLQETLQRLFAAGDESLRQQAAAILRTSDLYRLFEIMEGELLERVGLNFPTRERILALLSSVRYEAADQVTRLEPKEVVASIAELKTWICNASSDETAMAEAAQEDERMRERHTGLVNGLGTVAIVVNAGAVFAAAASVLFLPILSAGACAASAVAGAVAQRLKSGKSKPSPGAGGPGTLTVPRPPKGGKWKVT